MTRRATREGLAKQQRSSSGKFMRADGSTLTKRTSSGVYGPSRLNRLSMVQLAGRLVSLEDRETTMLRRMGKSAQERDVRPPARMITWLQRSSLQVQKRMDRLQKAAASLAQRGIDIAAVGRTELAELLSREMEEKITRRMLYRQPYRDFIDFNILPDKAATPLDSRERRVKRYVHDANRAKLIKWILKLESVTDQHHATYKQEVTRAVQAWTPLSV